MFFIAPIRWKISNATKVTSKTDYYRSRLTCAGERTSGAFLSSLQVKAFPEVQHGDCQFMQTKRKGRPLRTGPF